MSDGLWQVVCLVGCCFVAQCTFYDVVEQGYMQADGELEACQGRRVESATPVKKYIMPG